MSRCRRLVRSEATLKARARRSAGGFTLIEVCIALFIVVIGILPIVALALSARRLDEQAQMQAVAYQVAWRELETLRALPIGARPVTTQTSFAIPATITQTYPSPGFTGTYSVATVSGLGDATHAVQQIAVAVFWKNDFNTTATSSARVSAIITQGAGT